MFRTSTTDIAGVPGMFGDELTHWHGVSRVLASQWYHVIVKRRVEDRMFAHQEFLNDELRLKELLEGQGQDLEIIDVQVVTPPWINGQDRWQMERLAKVSVGVDKYDCVVSLMHVESGKVYHDSRVQDFDPDSLVGVNEVYRAPGVQAA
jgi:hypothetical protein